MQPVPALQQKNINCIIIRLSQLKTHWRRHLSFPYNIPHKHHFRKDQLFFYPWLYFDNIPTMKTLSVLFPNMYYTLSKTSEICCITSPNIQNIGHIYEMCSTELIKVVPYVDMTRQPQLLRQTFLSCSTRGKAPYILQQKLLLAAIIISPHYLRSTFPVTFNLLGMHSFTMWETIAWAGKCFRAIWTLIRSCTSVLINVEL
jgi:hypothetical protein